MCHNFEENLDMRNLIVILLFCILGANCVNNSTSKENETLETHEHQTINKTKTQIDSSFSSLELNQGKKWLINPEMLPHLKVAKAEVNNFKRSDFKKLALSLENHNQKLIKSCTMKGESHDMLHVWLHPYLELVEELKHANNVDESLELTQKIKKAFINFDLYFE